MIEGRARGRNPKYPEKPAHHPQEQVGVDRPISIGRAGQRREKVMIAKGTRKN